MTDTTKNSCQTWVIQTAQDIQNISHLNPNLASLIDAILQNKINEVHYICNPSYFAKNVLVAVAMSQRHVEAVAESSVKHVKECNIFKGTKVDGNGDIGWIAVDVPILDCIIHVMIEEKFLHYRIVDASQRSIVQLPE